MRESSRSALGKVSDRHGGRESRHRGEPVLSGVRGGASAGLEATLRRLEALGVRLGLETTRRLLDALGQPQRRLRTVLIAGTNGKGSTAALLTSIALAAGYRTGLYTSPHLETVEERIRVAGRAVETGRLAKAVTEVVEVAERVLGYLPTYFEALTAAAFCLFAEEAVELAVLEVGLGGRLDATNGADPVLSLITEIGLEHQHYLGTTLASIAREKAGILRGGRPAVAWVERQEARQAIATVARDVGAELAWGPDQITVERIKSLGEMGQRVGLRTSQARHDLFLPLAGQHQVANVALAVLAAERLAGDGLNRIDASAIARGVAGTRWPGRLEWVDLPGGESVILDVAHNPDGAATLRQFLASRGGRYKLLFGALADKEVGAVLPELAEEVVSVVLTAPNSERAMAPERLASLIPEAALSIQPDREEALSEALAAEGDCLVVCGSLYLVGDVRAKLRQRFGVPPPATQSIFSG